MAGGIRGRPKFTFPPSFARAALGSRAVTVFRGDLEAALYEAVRELTEIRFGTTVERIENGPDGVSVTLDDGRTEHADLLIGADGLHSGVRAVAFGPEADFRVDFRHLVAAFSLSSAPAGVPDAAGATYIGLGRTAAVVNLGPTRSSAFFTYRCADADADADAELARGPVDALTRAFGDLGGGLPDALEQLAGDPSGAYFDAASQIVAGRWRQGRVVLLGDAAWCVTVFAGFGATLALTGADRLGAALDAPGVDLDSALDGWESGLRKEVVERQAAARKGMIQFAPPTRAHVWLGDLTMRAMTLPGMRGVAERKLQRADR